jgi:hypothetical protein
VQQRAGKGNVSDGPARLGRKREQAVVGLLTRRTVAEAAASAGISERTLKGWLADDAAFQAAYAAAKNQLVDRTLARLITASDEAVQVLVEEFHADRPGDRIRAAVAVLGQMLKGRDQQARGGKPAADPLLDLLYRATNGHHANGGAR